MSPWVTSLQGKAQPHLVSLMDAIRQICVYVARHHLRLLLCCVQVFSRHLGLLMVDGALCTCGRLPTKGPLLPVHQPLVVSSL